MNPKQTIIENIRIWLSMKGGSVLMVSAGELVRQARASVYGASQLPEDEIRSVVARFVTNEIFSPRMSPLPAPMSDSRIFDLARKAVSPGVKVKFPRHFMGKIAMSTGGVTSELKKGTASASLSLSWTGALGIETAVGAFHLSGELSNQRWEAKLTFPEDVAAPAMDKLGKDFGEAETALGGICRYRQIFQPQRFRQGVSRICPRGLPNQARAGFSAHGRGPSSLPVLPFVRPTISR
jgi:hypothetical protein